MKVWMTSKVVFRDPVIKSIERIESFFIKSLIDFRNFDEYDVDSFNRKSFIQVSLARATSVFNLIRFATTALWNSVNYKKLLNLSLFIFLKANGTRADV